MRNIYKKLGVVAAGLVAGMSTASAAITSAIPADLSADQAVITGDVATAGATVIAIVLVALGVRKVVSMFR